MDPDDRRLFEAGLRRAAAEHSGTELDRALHALGWADALVDEPDAAAAAWFAVQGELNVVSAALDDVIINALGLPVTADTAVVLPRLGSHDPAGTVVDNRVVIHGAGTSRAREAEQLLAIVARDDKFFAISLTRTEVELRPVDGLDPAGEWVEVRGELPVPVDVDDRPVDWQSAVAAGRCAVAQELTAASRAMLLLARDHAAERIQFGRPIGSFQAVRHRLADSLLAVESAAAAVAVGWAEPSPFTAAMAKAIAGRSSHTVARHAQQVLAGMGFTSEHAFHRYLKRSMVLDQLLGSGARISAEIGNEVLASRTLPSMLAL